MRTVKRGLVGLFSIVFLLGGVTMITPFSSEAEAGGYFKKHKRVSHQNLEDLILMLKDMLPTNGAGGDGNHTLRWDKILDSTNGEDDGCNSSRFKCIMNTGTEETPNYEAVLDLETGLVWERSLLATRHTFSDARFECTRRMVGGRIAWRLPSVHELASLVNPNAAAPPVLSVGHPFSNVESSGYWSTTRSADDLAFAWVVDFSIVDLTAVNKAAGFFVWCVRGGMNEDVY